MTQITPVPVSVDLRRYTGATVETVDPGMLPPTAVQHLSEAGLLSPQMRALTIGLVLLVTLIAFEAIAVATAMPVAQRDLGGIRIYGLVFSGYVVASLLGTAYAGQHGDRGNPTPALVIGLVLFGAGLAIAGAATSMTILVSARFVQGLGSGAIVTTAFIAIARGYNDAARPKMIAVLSSAYVVPGLVGPALAGAVADHLTWRLVFLGLLPLLPLCVLLTLPAMRRLPPPSSPEQADGRILLSLRLAVGAAAVLIGSTSGSLLIAAPTVIAGVVIGFPALKRLLPAGTLVAARGLPAAVAVMALANMAFFGAEAFLPLTLNEVRGQSPTLAGLALTAATLSWTAASWLQAQRAQTWSRRTMIVYGFGFVGAGIFIAGLTAWSEVPVIFGAVGWAVAGLGMGLAYSNIALSILADESGTASVSLQFANTLGIAAGTGLGGAVVAAGVSLDWSQASSVGIVFALMAGVAVLALATAFRLPAGRTSATSTSTA